MDIHGNESQSFYVLPSRQCVAPSDNIVTLIKILGVLRKSSVSDVNFKNFIPRGWREIWGSRLNS